MIHVAAFDGFFEMWQLRPFQVPAGWGASVSAGGELILYIYPVVSVNHKKSARKKTARGRLW
jgi:hypothetical protein